MKNIDLVKNFSKGETTGIGSNLKIQGNKLINYTTCIAYRVEDKIILNNKKYSKTTSTIQNYIRNECNILKELNEDEFKSLINFNKFVD